MSGCQCTDDGFCPRYMRPMFGRLREICAGENIELRKAAAYRDNWQRLRPSVVQVSFAGIDETELRGTFLLDNRFDAPPMFRGHAELLGYGDDERVVAIAIEAEAFRIGAYVCNWTAPRWVSIPLGQDGEAPWGTGSVSTCLLEGQR